MAADREDATLAAALFAVDPAGLGGVVVRGPASAGRDAWIDSLRALLPRDAPVRRCPLHIGDERLLGGLDLAASLAVGKPVASRGVLAEADGGVVLLPMAERISDAVAARIGAVMEQREVLVERSGLSVRFAAAIGIVALDEGEGPDERAPAALLERCAFHVSVPGACAGDFSAASVAAARAALPHVAPADGDLIEGLCAAAVALGAGSARAPLLALRAARACAALAGRNRISADDVVSAARLVLTPRATQAPASVEEPEPEPESSEVERDLETNQAIAPTDVVLAAVKAALPAHVLDDHGRRRTRTRAHAGGAGAIAASVHRGRPAGVRSGALRAGERLNVVETLRAAAPWQKLRGGDRRVSVRREDFRIRRFVERRESTTIFVVDASGSAAFHRLAEAKGAVELLLAKAYVSRARVALVAFRNAGAEVLLPPTRSLTRARRLLATLPGGGGTPLANGIEAALLLAQAEKARGRTPTLLLLSDARANVARDGRPGRAQAEIDALQAARRVGAADIAAIHIDTGPRPLPGAERLARAMGARYAPLPYVEAGAVLSVLHTPAAAR